MSLTAKDIQRIFNPNMNLRSLEQSLTSVECNIDAEMEETKQIEQHSELQQHGYKIMGTICTGLQGVLYEAEIFDRNLLINAAEQDDKNNRVNIIGHIDKHNHVVIKKTPKKLAHAKLAKEDGFEMVVDEDIVKEMVLMHHITFDNKAEYCVDFVNFFESDTDYYLIMEYVGKYNLLQFTQKAHQYIDGKKLSLKEWKKIVRFLLWQIAVTLYWLHQDLRICHLDLKLENIMVKNGNFIIENENMYHIDSKISIKIGDWGVAEVFKKKSNEKKKQYFDQEYETFKCSKNHYTDQYKSPQAFDSSLSANIYDARKADIYELGIILFFMCCNTFPYQNANRNDPGWYSIKRKKLANYLEDKNLLFHFNWKDISLLNGVLNINEIDRFEIYDVVQHEYFQVYYSKYKNKIVQKSEKQQLINLNQQRKLNLLPYYKMNKPQFNLLQSL